MFYIHRSFFGFVRLIAYTDIRIITICQYDVFSTISKSLQLLKARIYCGNHQKTPMQQSSTKSPRINLTVLDHATKLNRKDQWRSRKKMFSVFDEQLSNFDFVHVLQAIIYSVTMLEVCMKLILPDNLGNLRSIQGFQSVEVCHCLSLHSGRKALFAKQDQTGC